MPIRLNVRKLKGLLWFVGCLAFLAAGWTFWDIVQGKKLGRFTPRQPSYFQDLIWRDVDQGSAVVAGPAFYDEADYQRTWKARIDGSLKPPPEAPKAAGEVTPVKKVVPPIDTVLEVGMIAWNDDPLLRFVAVAYKDESSRAATGSKVKRLHLTEGEPLRAPYDADEYNGKVLRIDPQTVTFRWGEGEITVTPGLGREGTGVPLDQFSVAPQDDPARDYDQAPPESVQLADGSWVIGVKDQEALRTKTREMLDEELAYRSVTPTGGGHSYIELTNVHPNSLAAKYGFQTGDRIISVNGIPMPSMSAAINWAKNNPSLPQYQVLFERKGKQLSTTVHWKP